MADNVETSSSAGGGAIIATDEISGVQHQRVKVQYGDDGSATDVSATNPLPTVLTAGTAAVGKLAANSGVDIGDVTVNNAAGAPVYIAPGTGVNLNTSNVTIGAAIPAGTNNIGDVDVLTQPARAATTDTITAKLATDVIQDGTTALIPKYAVISTATSGDQAIVAAVAAKKIRVLNYTFVCTSAITLTWKSATTAISGAMAFAANTGATPPFTPYGHFETVANEALNLNLSASTQVSGHLTYVEV